MGRYIERVAQGPPKALFYHYHPTVMTWDFSPAVGKKGVHPPLFRSIGSGVSDTSRPLSHDGLSLLLPSQLPFCRM